ncbi:tetratricopeptide repeat protein [Rhizobium sp. WL3]|uniref:tetratricopeptide repeat protein n=1 Tax=Rhizobium sp. WL3 TaxID=2603277 RepID=UPI001650BAF2|nr:tetratricopeptide repeat protein [Rhizobium sp. WL3]
MLLPKILGAFRLASYKLSLAVGGLFLAMPVFPAIAQQSQNVAPRTGSISLDAIEAKRKALFERMMAALDDLDTAFEYAALSSQAGDLEGAISTLERMLIYAPGLPRLQLELGVLYYRLGAYETARQYFEGAKATGDVPPEVSAKVDQYLTAIDRRGAPSQLSGMLRTGLRYQSNANAGPLNSTVTLNGLSYTLDDLSVAGEDFNAFVNGGLRYRHDTDIQGLSLEAGVSGYAAGYRDRDTLNTAAVDAYAGPVFDLGRFGLDDRSLSVMLLTSGVLIEGDRYLASAGISTNFDWQMTPVDSFSASLQYRYEDYSNTKSRQTAELQSGNRFDAQASWTHNVSEDFSLTGRMFATRRDAETGYLSSTEVGGAISGTYRYAALIGNGPAWIIGLEAAVAARAHDDPDAMINAGESQRDTDFSLNLRQITPFNERVALVAEAGYRKVWSNYDIKSFDNISLSIGLQAAF